jgi:hypothetical protein
MCFGGICDGVCGYEILMKNGRTLQSLYDELKEQTSLKLE